MYGTVLACIAAGVYLTLLGQAAAVVRQAEGSASCTFGDPAEDVLEGAGDDAGGLAIAALHGVRLPAPCLAVGKHSPCVKRTDHYVLRIARGSLSSRGHIIGWSEFETAAYK